MLPDVGDKGLLALPCIIGMYECMYVCVYVCCASVIFAIALSCIIGMYACMYVCMRVCMLYQGLL